MFPILSPTDASELMSPKVNINKSTRTQTNLKKPPLTIFLSTLAELYSEGLGFRTRWQHDSPPYFECHSTAGVPQYLHCCAVLHVLQAETVGTHYSIVHSVKQGNVNFLLQALKIVLRSPALSRYDHRGVTFLLMCSEGG